MSQDSVPEPHSGQPIASRDTGREMTAHDHLKLGGQFAEIVRRVTGVYIANYGDDRQTRRRARHNALEFITRLHAIGESTVRLYINAFERFHAMPRAVEFLRLTDMQLLLAADIGDDIVEAVIARRVADPTVSTRMMKEFINSMRSGGRKPEAPAV